MISQALPGEISAMQAASQIRKHEMGLTLPAVHIVAMVDKFETVRPQPVRRTPAGELREKQERLVMGVWRAQVDTELCFSSGMNGIIS